MSPATAAQTSFESILDMPATDVERPKPVPAGTYDAIVKGLYEEGLSSQKKTPFVQFAFALQAAGEDVDAEELEAVGGIEGKVIKNNSTKFYTTPDSLYRLTEAIEAMGVDMEGKTIRQSLADTPNCSVKLQVIHEASQDGETIFASVKKVMSAD
jgi:hypothetical protein